VSENPDVNLPASLDSVFENLNEPFKGLSDQDSVTTLETSIKEFEYAIPWTEVVRRGVKRIKSKSMSNKINSHDRCILEYNGGLIKKVGSNV
jgi:hypothetical protein